MMRSGAAGKERYFPDIAGGMRKQENLQERIFNDMSLIHRYQSNGYNIVLDINSGCIHLVDSVTYDVLPYMGRWVVFRRDRRKTERQIQQGGYTDSISECEKLKKKGMLFTRDIYENAIDEFTKNRQT